MTTSSQQDPYSITLTSDDLTTSNTINIDNNMSSSHYAYDAIADISTITLNGSSNDYITINSDDYNIQYEIDFGEEWRTHFPDFNTVEHMSKYYPALSKALENFKTIYEMVKDDYASKIRDKDQ